MTTTVLKVTGMTCGHCVKAVSTALRSVRGVTDAQVDLEQGRAVVEHDTEATAPTDLTAAVMAEGYMAEEVK